MSQTSDLIDEIYMLSASYDIEKLDHLLDTTFESWVKDNKFSEIDTILYGLKLDNLKKKAAISVIKNTYFIKDKLSMYKYFWNACNDHYDRMTEEITSLKKI